MADPRPPLHPGLRLIAVAKLLKAALLLVVGFGSLRLLNPQAAEAARAWAHRFSIDPENHFIRWAASKVSTMASDLGPIRLRSVGHWSLFFAADQIIEGLGLWYNQAWAKYFLFAGTAVFFCVDSYHFVWDVAHHRLGYLRVASLGIAIALLVYLFWIFRMDRRRAARHT